MAARLRQHTFARIDQDDGGIGGRGTGDHVASVLLVARCVGDDELPFLGREEAVGDVDRDALFALGGEPVDQKREIDILALRADPLAVRLQRGKLIGENRAGIVEQTPDQRRLAVIDRPAGDEAQQRLALVLFEIGGDVRGDEGVGQILPLPPGERVGERGCVEGGHL
ncbi:hypothetical protein D9M73_207730 [compost metagenome]